MQTRCHRSPVRLAKGKTSRELRSVLLVGAILLSGPAMAQRVAAVRVDEVRVEAVSQTFPVIGRLVARHGGVVATRVEGPVKVVQVAVGDRVAEGQVLAVLVRDRLNWELELRQADLSQRAAELQTAKSLRIMVGQELARLARLKKSRSAAFQQARFDDKRVEMATLKSGVAEAQARVQMAQANLNLARIDLEEAEIRAPYSGVVTLRHTEAGAYVKIGEKIVTLVADGSLEIEADVPADRIPGLVPGTTVRVRLGDGGQNAVVRAVVPEENPLTRTRAVRFTPSFDVAGGNLATNQSVTVEIPIGAAREAMTVHKDAVLNRQNKTVLATGVNSGVGFEAVANLTGIPTRHRPVLRS